MDIVPERKQLATQAYNKVMAMLMHSNRPARPAQKVGVFVGGFDPVHSGHIAFALQAKQAAGLDIIYFVPERLPYGMRPHEHFAHRLSMLRQALKPHPALLPLEQPDKTLNLTRLLQSIYKQHPYAKVHFIIGSDVLNDLPGRKQSELLFDEASLIVGIRNGDSRRQVFADVAKWLHQPSGLLVLDSIAPRASSSAIRDALRAERSVRGLLTSVLQYSRHQWLYVSLSKRAKVNLGHTVDK